MSEPTNKPQPKESGAIAAFLLIGLVLVIFAGLWMLGNNARPVADAQMISAYREEPERVRTVADSPQLELLSWSWEIAYGFIDVQGEVKNLTSQPIDNVMGMASFLTADGVFVKSTEAMIAYQPLMPGQTSPFQLITSYNPSIKTGRMAFKSLFGAGISTRHPVSKQNLNRREWVAWAQSHLLTLGLDPGPADGRMGPKTRAAIEAYQRSHGKAVTGKVTADMFD